MPQSFVRYSPDVERADPDFEQALQTVLDMMKRHMNGSLKAEGIGRVVRDAHAKGYGLAQAEVEILGGLPEVYAQGIYANPGATKPWSVSRTGRVIQEPTGSWARQPASA